MTGDPLGPSLSWALSRILPGREESWLLRAILGRGDAAREAWQAFTSEIGDVPSLFRTDTGGRKRLGPLLLAGIRENGLPADPELLTVLRTAYLREELRQDAFRTIAGKAIHGLRAAGIPFLVLKGTALAETVYPEVCLRHSHDIDLLVREEDMEGATRALVGTGLAYDHELPRRRGVSLRHRTETPVMVLNRLYRQAFYLTDTSGLWSRAVDLNRPPYGPMKALSAPDNLVHALTHASYCPGRSNLLWVTDAWMILHASEPLDWQIFMDAVLKTRAEIPTLVMLQYLGDELGAPIPGEVMVELAEAVARGQDGGLRRDVALRGARAHRGRHPSLSGLQRPGWKDRMRLVWWGLFPSRSYVKWAYGGPPGVLLPFIYLMRPFTSGGKALGWRLVGMTRRWAGR